MVLFLPCSSSIIPYTNWIHLLLDCFEDREENPEVSKAGASIKGGVKKKRE